MKKLFSLKVFISTLIALIIFSPSYTYAESQQENYIEEGTLKKIKAPILPNQKTIKEVVLSPKKTPVIDEVDEVIKMNTKKETNSKEITVTVTAYTAFCNGCSGITATGINLRKNPDMKVIAVDPKIIPLGSKVYVPGYGDAIAGDKGGAIKGNKIDVFIKDKSSASKWGKQTLTITVYE